MQQYPADSLIQGKELFKKTVNMQLIHTKQIMNTLKDNSWVINKLMTIQDIKIINNIVGIKSFNKWFNASLKRFIYVFVNLFIDLNQDSQIIK